jgi:hypothetical protein
MKLAAWIQMGVERRETTIEISSQELEGGNRWVAEDPLRSLEGWLEEFVRDWIDYTYGWGWSCGDIRNDFGFMEASDGVSLVVTSERSIPNTRAFRLDLNRELVRCPHTNLWLLPGTRGPWKERLESVPAKIFANESID